MGNLRFCIFGALLVACGGNDGNSGIPDPCNPLGGQGCLMPWPSMGYTKTDSTSPTGIRVDIPIEAMPVDGGKIAIDPKMVDRWDGFSPTGPMLAMFPGGVARD
ncbi:MAG: hypothetical protein ABI678_26215, partial [Kofleriaceae bacterium]